MLETPPIPADVEPETEPPLIPVPDDGPTTWDLVVLGAVFLWVILVAGSHAPLWGSLQLTEVLGFEPSIWLWPGVLLGQVALLGLPLILLAWRWPTERYRGIYQSWALGTLFALLMVPLRLLFATAVEEAALGQVVLALLFSGALFAWQHLPATATDRGAWLPALLLAALPLYPWLAWGSLGSILDTGLQGLAGLTLGLAAGLILRGTLLPVLAKTTQGLGWDITVGGFAIGTLLLIMAVAFGFQGMGLLLMLVLPSLGWAAMALSRWGGDEAPGQNWRAVALLVGAVAAGMMALVDADEMLIVMALGTQEIFYWALTAATVSLLLGWVLGVALFARRAPISRAARSSPLVLGTTGGAWALGVLLYATLGQPGLHGDRLFVILKDQADLSGARQIEGREARLAFVYDTLVGHADRSQTDLRSSLDQMGATYQPFYLVNAIEVEGGLPLRLWLESRPEVDRVLYSPMLRPLPEPEPPARGEESAPTTPPWGLEAIGAPRVWEEFGVTGEGIVIGQSDSGVQWDHPEFRDSYRGQDGNHDYNWYDPWNHTPAPVDNGGHGTHTLGSVLGENVGVAPDATWFGCANLARNLANPALYLGCMQFMLAPFPLGGDPMHDGDPTFAAHVLNNSWGCPTLEGCDPEALRPAVHALREAGIFVVASAGNEGYWGCSTIKSPLSLYDEVFSVGAIQEGGGLTNFSSLGPVSADGSGRLKPDIVAPGKDILSAFPGNSYASQEGTSMAGPHVVGVVALLWSANPALIGDIERTEQIIIETAQPYRG
ncbi:MAG: S8 family serine peptidase, partial [Ardenticatenales bacterium]|nr:S8 family serine peptidase [Ardenticatenales bacterium]